MDQLLSCMLDVDPNLLFGVARPNLSECLDNKLLKKLTQEQVSEKTVCRTAYSE